MKRIVILSLLLSSVIPGFSQELPADYQWQNRVLLVFGPTPDHYMVREQLALWQPEHIGFKERNLVVFRIYANKGLQPKGGQLNSSEVKSLRTKYQISNEKFWVILIGKDGGTKLSSSELLTVKELFMVIDRMPMRRQEMADQEH